MQDPASITAFHQSQTPQFPEQEQLNCPRCNSNNTKFCYYNNYNLSQPRHYCKSCRRYWTKGGTLRNIPVGGGSRKTMKKSSSKRSASSLGQTHLSSSGLSPGSGQNSESESKPVPILDPEVGSGLGLPSPAEGGVGVGSFTSLLGMPSEGQFGNILLEGLGSNGLKLGQGNGPGLNMGLEFLQGNSGSRSEGLIIGGDQLCWGGSNNNHGWPDLAI